MFQLLQKGGPIMWPLLLTSLIALTVVFERILFIFREKWRRNPETVKEILMCAEKGDADAAISMGKFSKDFVGRTLVYGLEHRDESFSNALLRAANLELKRFNRGLHILDTIITLSPLLGLLGTVTGMIHAFGLLGTSELGSPSAITGGIAEALLATAFGLSIAIVSLIPFNYLNARLETARHEIQDAASHLELILMQSEKKHEHSIA